MVLVGFIHGSQLSGWFLRNLGLFSSSSDNTDSGFSNDDEEQFGEFNVDMMA